MVLASSGVDRGLTYYLPSVLQSGKCDVGKNRVEGKLTSHGFILERRKRKGEGRRKKRKGGEREGRRGEGGGEKEEGREEEGKVICI